MTNTTLEKWEEKTLGDVCTFLNGFAFESKKLKNIKDKNNNIPVIKIGNLQPNETVSLKESQYSYYDNSLSNFLIKKNDILFAMSGATVGKVSLFLSEEKALLNQRVGLIRLNEERTSLKFLLYQLYDKNFYDYCQRTSGGAAQPNISLKQVAHYQIKHPPLPEQERIVAKLDKAFEAIDKVKANAEQNLNNAKELFESTLNKALLKSETANIKTTFGKEFKIKSGDFLSSQYMDVGGKYNVYGGNGVNGNYNHYNCSGENIIIGRVGEKCGNVHYVNEDVWVTDNAFILTQTEHLLDKKFLYYLLTKLNLRKYAAKSTHPVISGKSMKDVLVCFPDNINTQQKIVEKLDALQEQTKQLEAIYTQKIKECDELKQSILQKAFRGEL